MKLVVILLCNCRCIFGLPDNYKAMDKNQGVCLSGDAACERTFGSGGKIKFDFVVRIVFKSAAWQSYLSMKMT